MRHLIYLPMILDQEIYCPGNEVVGSNGARNFPKISAAAPEFPNYERTDMPEEVKKHLHLIEIKLVALNAAVYQQSKHVSVVEEGLEKFEREYLMCLIPFEEYKAG